MTITVIIATYNRAALLDECLAQVGRQAFEAGDEIVVVDNGSTDATPSVIARHRQSAPVPLHHVTERRPGKSHALTRALDVATGDVLAFTDDDVLVDPSWLTQVRTSMTTHEADLIGGPVTPRWERRAPRWLSFRDEAYGRLGAPLALLDYGSEPADIGERTVLGANLAVRRDVLQRLGGFATHLGKLRGTLLSGEDHDLCRRVQAAGYKAMYSPGPRVRHWVPADRVRVRYFLSWFFWSGITYAALEESEPRKGRTVLGVPGYLLRRLARGVIGATAAMALLRFPAAVDRAADVAFVAGYAAKCWRLVSLEPRAASRLAA